MPSSHPDRPDSTDPAPQSGAREPSARKPLEPGLHILSTPIGAARDITLRALDILADADILAAEDTRSLRRLMEIHGIRLGGRPLWPYHDHNGAKMRPKIMAALAEGKAVAYASEAGTPLVADPGFQLCRDAIDAGHPLRAAPGASAVLAALAVGGLPTDRFCFMGFAPAQAAARRQFLAEAAKIPATLVFYESPKRVHRMLGEMADAFGKDRPCALCRELTKRFEEVIRGSLDEVSQALEGRVVKGEIVVLVDRARNTGGDEGALDASLRAALADHSLREAVDIVASALGLARRKVYQRALEIERTENAP
ncbi:MAG: 16S rRNA (cytidine(1402)-2'-O)-methyltransferase RsmI [Rhodobacteraceae bacterium HLUCCA12]|nr:MAG: 16S rRNA (cytidine(1402)-2'-O)-methyltransferase RsmI [Rhodobacteraceae bacterium HLUCCA12]